MFKLYAGLGGRITLVGIDVTAVSAGTGTVCFDDQDDGVGVVMANAAGTGTVWFDEKDDGVVTGGCSWRNNA